ncbi:hypothetical protein BC938DRAFT_484147 [Jimgerdemannia flammicorona]|uniref:Mid2 domain-containing protein n=1 Tax=Jimgerdemannia flammicorona TaxID=994334 RepID=A0A433QVA9_9FUNG|nr:hypothetical protein BC938DRAFT_484147 [Jimgerdemannia flammicorona]
MVLVKLLLLSLGAARIAAQSNYPWVSGNESQLACWISSWRSGENRSSSDTPTPVSIAGIDFAWVNPLPNTLVAGVPINSTVRLNLTDTFNSSGIFSSKDDTDKFTTLCINRQNSRNVTQPACIQPVSRNSCCVYFVNWHVCSLTYTNASSCTPWTQPGNIQVTESVEQYGFPGQTWNSGGFFLPQPDRYLILASFKMGNIQCAIGATRTVVGTNTSFTSTAGTDNSTGAVLDTNDIAGIVVGTILFLLLLALTILYFRRRIRRKSNDPDIDGTSHTSTGEDPTPVAVPPPAMSEPYNTTGTSLALPAATTLANAGIKSNNRESTSTFGNPPYTTNRGSMTPSTTSTATYDRRRESQTDYLPHVRLSAPLFLDDNPFAHQQQEEPYFAAYSPHVDDNDDDHAAARQIQPTLYNPVYYSNQNQHAPESNEVRGRGASQQAAASPPENHTLWRGSYASSSLLPWDDHPDLQKTSA